MARLPVVSGKQAIAMLERHGFIVSRQRGSHVRLRHTDGRRTTVPLHKELDRGTFRAIIRDAGLDVEDFRA